ncbi:SubName: Full=Uncharacterized protein {ECO:0000313/EMBL:CCA69083.1} [Serendipita indica DSM 11827]|nr:SubName: Full=Uncharacterized protein {ECO:0000313/EMBL:CCA69083.1} [Serendipita indica DSM 11827]
MLSFWRSKPTASSTANDETNGDRDSASPPPPSVVTETATPQPTAAPKPRKPRKSTKKAAPAGEGGEVQKEGADKVEATQPDVSNLGGLKELIHTVPPKTLYQFMVQRLDIQKPGARGKKKPNPNAFPTLENDFPVLSSFFTGLVVPPKKHCLRCHSDYFDIENGPRSCVREHDDDSAVVRRSAQGIHETFWGCCGQTVDGDGDQGPPAGFCFIGTHTSDREEARYRQDGTPEDDKLGDCAKLRCGTRKPKRKRATSMADDSEEDMDLSALEPRERHARRKSEAGPVKYLELQSDEDIVMSDEEEKKSKPKAAGGRGKKKTAEKDKEDKNETPEPSKPPRAKATGPKAKKAQDEAAPPTEKSTKKATKKRKTED